MTNELSSAALKKLGKRLRTGVVPEDLDSLDHYRRRFDPSLLDMNAKVAKQIKASGLDALVSGRIKRTKSIVRKLNREPSMDLSRMADIAGLRIVVQSKEQQDAMVGLVEAQFEKPRVIDRREDEVFYRAIHVVGLSHGLPIEIQLRSIPQQLWANESESLGEQVKEGGGTMVERQYLELLSSALRKIEDGEEPDLVKVEHELAGIRRPFEYRLPWINRKFEEAIGDIDDLEVRSEILVYDSLTSDIIHSTSFGESERSEAISEFERLSRSIDTVRYDVLILNTTSPSALCVTHPRFYL
jgi:ppGpp synthetase/RelA/SpoT-type nucleotidyltranferase